jgi:DNA polymerase-3 subunit alpha (Gram-positive type)
MLVFVDVETTGLSSEFDSLLEIAAVATDEQGNVIDKFHEYINPGRKIPAKIVELTHITDGQVACCRTEWEVLTSFSDWVIGTGCRTMIAHNAPFDMRFLRDRSRVRFLNNTPFDRVNVIDTMAMVGTALKKKLFETKKTPSGRYSKRQEDVAKVLGIEYGEGGAHSAINDVLVLRTLYFKLKNMGC